ncbi:MAG: cytochrome P460 family protein [Proteobacteria bacterium]|nr:cytochrome P460 family protein [Pseudomonadota bacterium]
MKARTAVLTTAAALAVAISLGVTVASAGPEKIEYPKGYQSKFVSFGQIDRYENATVRILYASPEAVTNYKLGQKLPDGTMLLIEARPAKKGADGKPLLDANGRFMPEDQILGVFVQQKRKGWATEYPENIRNPDWEYAVFDIDGTRRANVNTQPCMSCHKPRATDDYTFVFNRVMADSKNAADMKTMAGKKKM